MTPSDKERIAVVEALLKEHKINSEENYKTMREMLTWHDTKDQQRTNEIMSKINDMEKKFDETFVQRREVWAISSFIGFLVTLIGLTKIFITKQP